MDKVQKCIREMVHELGRLTVPEIWEVQSEWMEALEADNVPGGNNAVFGNVPAGD